MKHYPRPFVSFHPNAVKIFFYNGVVTRLSSWKAIDRSLLPWHHNRPVPDSQDATVCKQHIFPRLFYALFVLWIFPLFVFILSCQWKTKIMLFRGLESKEFIVNSKNSKEKRVSKKAKYPLVESDIWFQSPIGIRINRGCQILFGHPLRFYFGQNYLPTF